MKQITIDDYFGEKELSEMSETEMVSLVGKQLGLVFDRRNYDYNTYEYEAKYKGIVLKIELSTYSFSDQPIILYGYDNKKDKSGGGGPAESITEAVKHIKRIMERECERSKSEYGKA